MLETKTNQSGKLANRCYKDSVFTKLFSDKGKLLELYNAIENTSYGEDTDIQITTLENVLFMGQANDIAFVMDGKLVVLIEHQSTINYNMPLRMLIYMSKTYEKLTNPDDLYLKRRMSIPKPEVPCDDSPNTLHLSVKVININKGRNEELASRSETLNGYEIFVYLVKEYSKTFDR
ncbi:MAG: Rpn family recombination-promoting nuclease/putative transposase, partial [Fibromonadales bacterium]|nr:Rpn family recombination-promoting nuclease/putative transposase [Fibromonadales bacterium]